MSIVHSNATSKYRSTAPLRVWSFSKSSILKMLIAFQNVHIFNELFNFGCNFIIHEKPTSAILFRFLPYAFLCNIFQSMYIERIFVSNFTLSVSSDFSDNPTFYNYICKKQWRFIQNNKIYFVLLDQNGLFHPSISIPGRSWSFLERFFIQHDSDINIAQPPPPFAFWLLSQKDRQELCYLCWWNSLSILFQMVSCVLFISKFLLMISLLSNDFWKVLLKILCAYDDSSVHSIDAFCMYICGLQCAQHYWQLYIRIILILWIFARWRTSENRIFLNAPIYSSFQKFHQNASFTFCFVYPAFY